MTHKPSMNNPPTALVDSRRSCNAAKRGLNMNNPPLLGGFRLEAATPLRWGGSVYELDR